MADTFRPATNGAGQSIKERLSELKATLTGSIAGGGYSGVTDTGSEDYDKEKWITEETALEIVDLLKEITETIETRKKTDVLTVEMNDGKIEYNGYTPEGFEFYAPPKYSDEEKTEKNVGKYGQALITTGEDKAPEWSNQIGGITLEDGNIVGETYELTGEHFKYGDFEITETEVTYHGITLNSDGTISTDRQIITPSLTVGDTDDPTMTADGTEVKFAKKTEITGDLTIQSDNLLIESGDTVITGEKIQTAEVSADDLSGNLAADNITGTLPVAHGGTGKTSLQTIYKVTCSLSVSEDAGVKVDGKVLTMSASVTAYGTSNTSDLVAFVRGKLNTTKGAVYDLPITGQIYLDGTYVGGPTALRFYLYDLYDSSESDPKAPDSYCGMAVTVLYSTMDNFQNAAEICDVEGFMSYADGGYDDAKKAAINEALGMVIPSGFSCNTFGRFI